MAAGDPMRGPYYDVSSLFETTFDALEKKATAPGKPCGKALEDDRLDLRSPQGREVWVGVEGCRVTNDYPGIGGTRLTEQGLNDLKRFLTTSMPPPESFSPEHR